MLGSIIGDIIGSTYELRPVKRTDFPLFPQGSRFTDDSVLTAAVAEVLLGRNNAGQPSARSYALCYKRYYARYPEAGFGELFCRWAAEPRLTVLHSYGNGGAMRAAPIAFACDTAEVVLREARRSCRYTHRNQEAERGAQAVALAVYLARCGVSKQELRRRIEGRFSYDLSRPLAAVRPDFLFDCRASRTVPPAIRAFLESDDYESTVRLAVSLGGDSDTLACIAGGIAQAYYGALPPALVARAMPLLDDGLRRTAQDFSRRFSVPC